MENLNFIDLGLSVKWAEFNLGALPGLKPEDWYGSYYAWGETIGYKDQFAKQFNWKNYKFGLSPFTKYNNDGRIILESIDDAATISYSNSRIPTKVELEELKALPNEWVKNYQGVSGLNGRIFIGNGNILFIPAAGCIIHRSIQNTGDYCFIWTSSLCERISFFAHRLKFCQDDLCVDMDLRCIGKSIRSVQEYNKN